MAISRIETYHGLPAIVIDGKVMPPMMATIRTNDRTKMVVDAAYYRELGKSGIKIYFLICDTEWLKPGAFELFREEADILFHEVPDAYVMLRVGMHPPVSWCEENPDETLTYSGKVKRPMHLFTESYEADYPAMYSLASEKWRRDAGEALLCLLERIKTLPYADRIVGCFFAAGGTSEWYYLTPSEYTHKSNPLDSGGFSHFAPLTADEPEICADYSPAFRTAFSKYLKETYGTNEALRRAWRDETADIENPRIPTCEERYIAQGLDYDIDHPPRVLSNSPVPPPPANGTNIGFFLDFANYRHVYDFYRAWHIGTAESIISFGKLVKENYPDLLTGAFYGSAGSNMVYSMGQIGAVTRILDSGAIDFLASPGVYENRQPGGFTGQRQVFDSYSLRSSMFIVEEDARTHFENRYFARYVEMFSMDDSLNVLKREFGRNVCENLQAWWFDQLLGGKRYKDPEIYRLFTRQQEIAREAYEKDRRKGSEIAFIYDEKSYHVVSEETTHQMVELFRNYEIDLIGAPSDRYYVADLADPSMPDYKLYVFANAFLLSEADRASIHRKLAKNHATAVFLWGAGAIDPDASEPLSENNIAALTGMKMGRLDDGLYSGMMRLTRDPDNPIAPRLDLGELYGDFKRKMWASASSYMNRIKTSRVHLAPLFYADDPEAKTLARFVEADVPSISVKDTGEFVSVYYGSKHLNAEIVREFARMAGCHIFCDSSDVLYANRDYITLHAASSGKKLLHLPHKCRATELYSGDCLGDNTDTVTIDLLKGETIMLGLT